MIPYREIPSLKLVGPLELQPFGVLVAIGIVLGSWFAQRRARQEQVDLGEIRAAVAWAVVPGFIVAHLVAIVFYFPERITEEGPLVLLKIWSGISSYGGFIGALLGMVIYFRFVNRRPWLAHAEIIVQALILGWVFGRLGCTVAFDHPGRVTDFFMAMEFPKDGLPRHNLGFYEFLFTLLVLTPLTLWLYRRKLPLGSLTGWICVAYAPVRFALDFLRATDLSVSDTRYAGLTPAQYVSVAVLALGVTLLVRAPRLAAQAAAAAPSSGSSGSSETERARQESTPPSRGARPSRSQAERAKRKGGKGRGRRR